ncbi:uncharacterized protein LOC130032396 [Sorex fumeus]|uniref:uncharacterized protein LOC130032396 n=1 Tax=Sorex fumeus TaxID=62283 RepID=UPI0024AD37B4|nr:uncharacterized protein LOC130032396 [Sorex fumeus]
MGPFPVVWSWMLLATLCTDASFVDQNPRWILAPSGQAVTLQCILKDTQYPWMGWYQQDLQGQLQLLAMLRSTGDTEKISLSDANYQLTRSSDTELRLQVTNVTQSRTLFCTCSKNTVRSRPGGPGSWLSVSQEAPSTAISGPNSEPLSYIREWRSKENWSDGFSDYTITRKITISYCKETIMEEMASWEGSGPSSHKGEPRPFSGSSESRVRGWSDGEYCCSDETLPAQCLKAP